MSKAAKVKRKTFVAREDLINRLSEAAQERGYTLYALVNEIFELALEAEEAGVNLKGILGEYGIVKVARNAGFVLGLERLAYDMADLAYSNVKDQALKIWFEAGVWFAKRYIGSVKGSGEDCFKAFKSELEAFTWNASEFTIEKVKSKVYVRLVSPKFSESYTYLFKAFLSGTLEAFGYKLEHEEVGRGIIRLEALRKEADGEG